MKQEWDITPIINIYVRLKWLSIFEIRTNANYSTFTNR